MDAHELRDIQRSLKQGYRDDPASARIPAQATARIDVDGISCHVSTRGGEAVAGLHPAAGGTGELTCSADMALQALVACAGVTLASVATAMSIPIRSATITADGHWDARGTLGVDREAPVGLTDVVLRFDLDTDADEAKVTRLVELAERYCVIAQTLITPPTLTFTHRQTRRP
jgi:uncharacterized OsmC-like protein